MINTVNIQGMTCQHCVATVTQELMKIDGVIAVNVDLEQGKADIESNDKLTRDVIQSAIEKAGYSLEN